MRMNLSRWLQNPFIYFKGHFNTDEREGGTQWSDSSTIETSHHRDEHCSRPFKKSPRAARLRLLNHHFSLHSLSIRLRLSCYVFVCLGNGFQAVIVAVVTWWLMGKFTFAHSWHTCTHAHARAHETKLACLQGHAHSERNKLHPFFFTLTKWLRGDQWAVALIWDGYSQCVCVYVSVGGLFKKRIPRW